MQAQAPPRKVNLPIGEGQVQGVHAREEEPVVRACPLLFCRPPGRLQLPSRCVDREDPPKVPALGEAAGHEPVPTAEVQHHAPPRRPRGLAEELHRHPVVLGADVRRVLGVLAGVVVDHGVLLRVKGRPLPGAGALPRQAPPGPLHPRAPVQVPVRRDRHLRDAAGHDAAAVRGPTAARLVLPRRRDPRGRAVVGPHGHRISPRGRTAPGGAVPRRRGREPDPRARRRQRGRGGATSQGSPCLAARKCGTPRETQCSGSDERQGCGSVLDRRVAATALGDAWEVTVHGRARIGRRACGRF
mmetsp:Transcript_74919/g.236791  ORF Transcript_74919/g.236791 Transcript_74919/m.236791 type:complete len:300 (-) Transcript_74919:11-910(-)